MHSFLSISCKVHKGGLYIARRFPYAVSRVASVACTGTSQNLHRKVYKETTKKACVERIREKDTNLKKNPKITFSYVISSSFYIL